MPDPEDKLVQQQKNDGKRYQSPKQCAERPLLFSGGAALRAPGRGETFPGREGIFRRKEFGQIFLSDSNKVRTESIVDKLTADRSYFETAGGVFTPRQ